MKAFPLSHLHGVDLAKSKLKSKVILCVGLFFFFAFFLMVFVVLFRMRLSLLTCNIWVTLLFVCNTSSAHWGFIVINALNVLMRVFIALSLIEFITLTTVLKSIKILTCPAVLPSVTRRTARGTTSCTHKTGLLVADTVALSLTLSAKRSSWTGGIWGMLQEFCT